MFMEWLVLALLYASVGSLAAFLDKVLLNYKINPVSLSSFRLMSNALVALPLIFLLGFQIPDTNMLMMILAGSVIYSIAAITYFIALSKDDVSKLIPYRDALVTIISFSLAIILLAESTNMYRIAGTIAIAFGGYFVLTNGRIVLPKASTALLLMGVTSLLTAIFSVFVKVMLSDTTPMAIIFWNYLFTGMILFAFNCSRDRGMQIKTLNRIFSDKKILLTSLSASVFAVVAWYFLFTALGMNNASQVLPISGVLPMFVAIEGCLLLKERYGVPRVLATLLVVTGVYALYM
ncbi:DMT family transporter [archaeon]|nr:MAG: DMT family transporter [archaeon]